MVVRVSSQKMASSPNVPIDPKKGHDKREVTHAEMERVYHLENLLFQVKDAAELLKLDQIQGRNVILVDCARFVV